MSDKREVIGERHWDDIGYSAWASAEPQYRDVSVYFDVYEITATNVREGDAPAYPRGYDRKGANMSPDPVEDRRKAQVFLSGAVKWDGCSNWDFECGGMHFCDKEQGAAIGTLFVRLYGWAKELGMDRL